MARERPWHPAIGEGDDLIGTAIDDPPGTPAADFGNPDLKLGHHPGELPEIVDEITAFGAKSAHGLPAIARPAPIGDAIRDVHTPEHPAGCLVLIEQPLRLIG